MNVKNIFLAITTLILIGCSANPTEKRANLNNELSKAANDNFKYAQLCANVYRKSESQFNIDGVKIIGDPKIDDESGFYAEIYLMHDEKRPVIVFRGTDRIINDTVKTNKQKRLADKLVKNLLKNNPQGVIAIGHSLGGGLALRVSLKYQNVEARVFMPSWRTGISEEEFMSSNKRVVIVENGEWIKKPTEYLRNLEKRLKKLDEKKPPTYHRFNLLGGNIMEQHSIYFFARAMTKAAAKNGSSDAIQSLKINDISLLDAM